MPSKAYKRNPTDIQTTSTGSKLTGSSMYDKYVKEFVKFKDKCWVEFDYIDAIFDWEKFKEYVNTRHASNDPETVFTDLEYQWTKTTGSLMDTTGW